MKKLIITGLILLFAAVIYSAQTTIDDDGTLTTPQAMMQAIDNNFTELYGKWTSLGATHDTSAELDALYQAADANLTTYAGIPPSANVQTLLGNANYADFLTDLFSGGYTAAAVNINLGAATVTLPFESETQTIVFDQPDLRQPISDAWALLHFPAEKYPNGVTIEAIHIQTSATCTDVLDFEEWAQGGTSSSSTVEQITLSGTHTEDDGTLTDATIAADANLYVDLPATPTDIAFMVFTIVFKGIGS